LCLDLQVNLDHQDAKVLLVLQVLLDLKEDREFLEELGLKVTLV
jgi:hypothetical protein